MARSTGPVLLAGAVAFGNEWLQKPNEPPNWRVPVATVIAAGALALLERLSSTFAVGLAWIGFITELLAPPKPGLRAPVAEALAIVRGVGG